MNPSRTRPIGVTLISLAFLWIGCCGTLFLPLILLAGGMSSLWRFVLGSMIHSEAWLKAISYTLDAVWYLFYIAYAVIGYGLWKLKNWARKSLLALRCSDSSPELPSQSFFWADDPRNQRNRYGIR